MAKSYVQIPTAYLSGSGVVIGATSITINSFVDIYGNTLTMADFGDKGYCTVEPDTTNEESFTFTSITVNANNTVTLGGISTSLAKSPYTETSGLIRAHVGGSKVVVSDTVAFWATFGNKNNDEALVGRWTTPVTPVNPNDVVNKAYVDATATGLATLSAEVVTGTGGETIASGKVVYLLSTDSRWYLADSATASKSVGVLLGIAQIASTAGNPITVLLSGEDTKQSGLTANSTYYLSTSGGISTTKGANIRIVGRTKSGSATNFYVDFTNDPNVSLVDGSRTYAADTGAANAYVVTLVPAITAADFKAGFTFSFKATNANTTASTVNVNGLGVKTIKKGDGVTDLASGDIAAGSIVSCEYDGVNVIMLNQGGNIPLSAGLITYVAGEAVTTGQPLSYSTVAQNGLALGYDTSTSATYTTGTSNNLSLTVANNANRVLIVDIEVPSGAAVSGVTYNSVSMTQIDTQTLPGSANIQYSFRLTAPSTGANNITVTTTGSLAVGMNVIGTSYYNVDQTTPVEATNKTTTSGGGTFSLAISTITAGAVVHSGYTFNSSGGTSTITFSSINGLNLLNISATLGSAKANSPVVETAQSVTVSNTHTGSVNRGVINLVLKPSQAMSSGVVKSSTVAATVFTAARQDFVGFALQSVSGGANVQVQPIGVNLSQSGLTIGKYYYLQDTAGTIGLTPGTTTRLALKSLSATSGVILP